MLASVFDKLSHYLMLITLFLSLSITLYSNSNILVSSFQSNSPQEDLSSLDASKVCDANGFCVAKAESKISRYANENGKAPEVDLSLCQDRHESCKVFTQNGECTKNPGWMIVNCARSCESCHLLDSKVRCDRDRLNISSTPAYAPGELNAMFEGIEARFGERYGVTVLSKSPWVVTFDNFLTAEEASALISTASSEGHGWERSTDTGSVNAYGETGRVLSQGRTSSNAWCRQKCESHPAVKRITQKIEEVIRVPFVNSESFQVLRYELNQKYQAHHDMSERQVKLICGPRILTFFLYLSDVEEGGETAFPGLNLSVTPRKGKALLWPSVLDSNLEVIDQRTIHEAKPVIRGVKYAANSWIHLYDFATPNLWGCTGTFD